MNSEINDERVNQIINKAFTNAAIVAEAILLIKILFEIFTDRATLGTTGWDIGLLIIMNIIVYITLYRSKIIQVPRTLFGKPLSTKETKFATRERLIKSYVPESFLAAAGLLAGSYFSSGYNGFAAMFILYLFYFGFYLALTYFLNEREIKRYNEDLEEDPF